MTNPNPLKGGNGKAYVVRGPDFLKNLQSNLCYHLATAEKGGAQALFLGIAPVAAEAK